MRTTQNYRIREIKTLTKIYCITESKYVTFTIEKDHIMVHQTVNKDWMKIFSLNIYRRIHFYPISFIVNRLQRLTTEIKLLASNSHDGIRIAIYTSLIGSYNTRVRMTVIEYNATWVKSEYVGPKHTPLQKINCVFLFFPTMTNFLEYAYI